MNNSTQNDTALMVTSSNFESRKVQQLTGDTLRIKPTLASVAFSLLFVVLGLILVGFWVVSTFTTLDGPGSVPLLLIGILFLAAGVWMYHSSNEQLIINRDSGVAFIRSWNPSVPLNTTSLYNHILPQDIAAIQTVSRVVKHRSNKSRKRSSLTEYQVNFCTSDNERYNAFVTLNAEKAEALARKLSNLFGVPYRSV